MKPTTYSLDFEALEARVMINCQTCGNPFEAGRYLGSLGPVHCEPCIDRTESRANAERDALLGKNLTHRWDSLCPKQFMTEKEGGPTDEIRMFREQPLFANAMRWQFGAQGLLLVGGTGRCKTRIAWRLLRRQFDEGRKVQAITAVRFDIEALEYMRTNGFKGWFDRLAEADVLLIDDLGKGRFTDAVESRFFGLIDERTAACRPCIITSNDDGASLEARMSEHRGAATIRRLRDCCEVITFS